MKRGGGGRPRQRPAGAARVLYSLIHRNNSPNPVLARVSGRLVGQKFVLTFWVRRADLDGLLRSERRGCEPPA